MAAPRAMTSSPSTAPAKQIASNKFNSKEIIPVLNAFLDDYLVEAKKDWNSWFGITETAIKVVGHAIRSLLPSSGEEKRPEAKSSNPASNEVNRTQECDDFKSLFNTKLELLEQRIQLIKALGDRATDVQSKYQAKLARLKDKSDYPDYLHAIRTLIINKTLESSDKEAYLAHIASLKKMLVTKRKQYEKQLLQLVNMRCEKSIEEALKEKLISERPAGLTKFADLKAAHDLRIALDTEYQTYTSELLALAHLGDKESIEEATKRNLFHMYTFPISRLAISLTHGGPLCYQFDFDETHFKNEIQARTKPPQFSSYAAWMQNAIKLESEEAKAAANAKSTSSDRDAKASGPLTGAASQDTVINGDDYAQDFDEEDALNSASIAGHTTTPSTTATDLASQQTSTTQVAGPLSSGVALPVNVTSDAATSGTSVTVSVSAETESKRDHAAASAPIAIPSATASRKGSNVSTASSSPVPSITDSPVLSFSDSPVPNRLGTPRISSHTSSLSTAHAARRLSTAAPSSLLSASLMTHARNSQPSPSSGELGKNAESKTSRSKQKRRKQAAKAAAQALAAAGLSQTSASGKDADESRTSTSRPGSRQS